MELAARVVTGEPCEGRGCVGPKKLPKRMKLSEFRCGACTLVMGIARLVRAASSAATAKERERCARWHEVEAANERHAYCTVPFCEECGIQGAITDTHLASAAAIRRGDEQEGAPSARTDAPKKE